MMLQIFLSLVIHNILIYLIIFNDISYFLRNILSENNTSIIIKGNIKLIKVCIYIWTKQ